MSKQGVQMLFKSIVEGTSKKNGRPYYMVELHDVNTLENVMLFVPDDRLALRDTIAKLTFKQPVLAQFDNVARFGRIQSELVSLTTV